MQTAMTMLMVLSGIGCHHQGCQVPTAGVWASHQGHGFSDNYGYSATAGCCGYSNFYGNYACYDGGYSSGYNACYSSPYIVGCYAPAYPIGAYFGMGTVYAPGPGVTSPMFGIGEISSGSSSSVSDLGISFGNQGGAAKPKAEEKKPNASMEKKPTDDAGTTPDASDAKPEAGDEKKPTDDMEGETQTTPVDEAKSEPPMN